MTAQAGVGPGHRLLDRYEIVRHVATGGMGTVWEARDLALDQVVALKSVGFAALGGTEAENSRLRTLREARFAAQLRGHPHVVSIYDVQEVDGEVWLVMEYLPSRTLAEITRDGETISVSEAARIGAAVADALAAAHERGIIHRDIKPANVLVGLDGRVVRLTDFGISHAVGEHPLTSANVLSGTPAYMSREVARGDDETPATDVFSLGATLYRIVEGRPPFGEDTNHRRLLQRVANDSIDLPRRAGPLTPVLLHLLDADPAARPDAARARHLLSDVARATGRSLDPVPPPVLRPPGRDAAPTSITATPPRRRRFGRRAVLAGVAVLAAAGLLAGGVVYATSDPTAIPSIPSSLPASLAMTGDPRTADPCAMLDPVVMGRFGQPTRIGPGPNVGACRLTVPTPTGTAVVHTAYSTVRTRDSDTGTRQDLGGATIVRPGMTTTGCTSLIVMDDGTQLSIDVSGELRSDAVQNLCEINEAAVAVAADRLASSGIVHRPGWQGPIGLLGLDPCRILDGAIESVPGLDVTRRNGYPSGSRCFIGANEIGRPLVDVMFGLEPTGDFSSYGTPTTVGGSTVYTYAKAPDANGTITCDAYLVHRASYDGGASGPGEYIDVGVSGRLPSDQLCAQAVRLVQVAERRASA